MCEVIVCCNCGYWGEINEIWRAKVTSTWALVKAAQMKVCVKLSLELWPSVFYRLCFLNVWTLNIRESMPGVVLCHKFMPTHMQAYQVLVQQSICLVWSKNVLLISKQHVAVICWVKSVKTFFFFQWNRLFLYRS